METKASILDIAISSLTFLTVREKILLSHHASDADELARLSVDDISFVIGRTLRRVTWDGQRVRAEAERAAVLMREKRICAVFITDSDFPVMLATIPDAPYAFYYRGSLEPLKKRCVSVVGTRRVCEKSALAAYNFARDAANAGLCVVSGLAYGIDTFAHRGSLAAETSGCAVAILPCGIETVVPYGNRNLAARILATGGCIASEYIPGVGAEAWRFVQRNRIVAALSSCTVVIHAPQGSGALITAQFALDYNRDVMFHSAGFCKEAIQTARPDKGKKTLCNSKRFLEDGAPVIDSYSDYVAVRKCAPGTFIRDRAECSLDFELDYADPDVAKRNVLRREAVRNS